MDFGEILVTQFMEYRDGHVTRWGPPNGYYIVDVPEHLREYVQKLTWSVPAWFLLRVEIWWKYPPTARWYEGDRWSYRDYFWCRKWADIPIVYQRFWATGGLYERVSFSVEKLIWTETGGWETEDHV